METATNVLSVGSQEAAGTAGATGAAIAEAVEKLRQTYASGRTRTLEWRVGQLKQIRSILRDEGSRLLEALRQDLAKPEIEAWATEINFVDEEVRHCEKHVAKWMRPERVGTPLTLQPAKSSILREPLGVVLIIAPWNYPVQLLLGPLVGAVAAGNCVVLKPSELTPNTSAALADLVARHLDGEAITLVEGGVEETSALLAQRFDHIFFTGSAPVGRIVMQAAAKYLTPVTLELGGKSPCIVLSDANLDVAARRIAWGKFINAGQTCVAPDYVLVEESIEGELLSRLKAAVRQFYTDRPKNSPDFARVVSDRHYQRLAGMLRDGEVVAGGESDPAQRFIAPTILRNVRPDSTLLSEEIFGPILPVVTVPSADAAIQYVRERDKPLALYVFTNNKETADRILAQTSSGGATVNGAVWHVANHQLPFGGVGASGMGAYHGRLSFETFTHRKGVLRKAMWADPSIAYPPYTRFKVSLLKKLL